MNKQIKLNVLLFFLYILFFNALGSLESFFIFRVIQSLLFLLAIVIIPGINITLLIQYFSKKIFSPLEFFSISSIISLLFPPLAVSFLFSQFGILSKYLPLTVSVFIFIFLFATQYAHKKKSKNSKEKYLLFSESNLKLFLQNFFSFPLIFPLLFLATAILIIATAYYPLTDLDPYYWITSYSKNIANGIITPLEESRPLFSSLIFIFNQGAKIDLYAIFKYILPSLTLLISIPAILLANKFKSPLQKIIILLLPFVNSSAFLYLQLPIPQSILLIAVFYFTFFLLYAWRNSDNFFYYAAGAIILSTCLFHESGFLIFATWLLVALFFNRKILLEKITENKVLVFLSTAIFLLGILPAIKNYFIFATAWIKKVCVAILNFHQNFLFPARYENIDRNEVGWAGASGVAKYYTYYAGAFSLFIILLFATLCFSDKNFRSFVKNNILKNPALFTLFVLFAIFFSISEILPRFFNISLLPERSWNLVGIFSILFLITFFSYFKSKKKIICLILIILLAINAAGAIYVNNTKKYLITENQLQSAEWIKKNLPKNRIIFSADNKNLLSFYSNSKFAKVSPDFYYNASVFQNEIHMNFSSSTDKNKHYVYYSAIDKNNPYAGRPYYDAAKIAKKNQGKIFIFDKYPDKFKRIYFDEENNIIIWEIL
jgi:hypothetical protein